MSRVEGRYTEEKIIFFGFGRRKRQKTRRVQKKTVLSVYSQFSRTKSGFRIAISRFCQSFLKLC